MSEKRGVVEVDAARAQIVELTARLADLTDQRDTVAVLVADLAQQVAGLSERCAAQVRQVADLGRDLAERARQVEALTQERDYLRQAHAAALTLTQRLLPERTDPRHWRWPWQREPEPRG